MRERPLHLSAFASVLGERSRLSEIPQLVRLGVVDRLLEDGFEYYRRSTDPSWRLGATSLAMTVDRSPSTPPAATVLCSRVVFETQASGAMMTEANLPTTPSIGLSGSSCGNLGPGLRVARSMILAEGAPTIAVVTADCFPDDDRWVELGQAVASDAAASCLVTLDPVGPSYELEGLAVTADSHVTTRGSGAAVIARTLRSAVKALFSETSTQRSDYAYVVTGNFGSASRRFLAAAAGPGIAALPSDDIVREVGHCAASDTLITLAALDERQQLRAGDRVLVLSTGPHTWTALALRYHC